MIYLSLDTKMMWLLFAFLSNFAFAFQDLIAYNLTGAKTYNSFAVGTAMHLWVAGCLPLIVTVNSLAHGNMKLSQVFAGQAMAAARGAGWILPLYALALFTANGFLYEAYSVGAREGDINPGVAATLSNGSLIISASLPVLFYGSEMTSANILGIVLYLAGAYYLVDSKPTKTTEEVKPREDKDVLGNLWWEWLFYSVGSGVLYGLAAFAGYVITKRLDKKAAGTYGLTYSVYLSEATIGVLLLLFTSVFPNVKAGGLLAGYGRDLIGLLTSLGPALTTLGGGMAGAAGINALFQSYRTAPNPGFSDAISNLYTATTAVMAWMIYGTSLSKGQMFGMLLAGASVVLLSR